MGERGSLPEPENDYPMPLLPYALARPMLFRMDPEDAHELMMKLLARSQGTPLQWAYCNQPVDDPIELAGLRFPNKVGLAAGLGAAAGTGVWADAGCTQPHTVAVHNSRAKAARARGRVAGRGRYRFMGGSSAERREKAG
jgi:hypothetical protein